MPYMKLKLFPHQEAAVEWMLKRGKNSEPLVHTLCKNFSKENGFLYFIIVRNPFNLGVARPSRSPPPPSVVQRCNHRPFTSEPPMAHQIDAPVSSPLGLFQLTS
ncbi:hypothetical protein ACQJBY_027323 [Aegilops geniculata]